ncbi:MAG: tetratricopeptide repeat protein [Hydrogenobacter sp.]|uniref:tetratricopeptide repeat protein n=1 Tax=Hydrogenobacter thermophilus TaxID=940 RepID=UPI0030F851E8
MGYSLVRIVIFAIVVFFLIGVFFAWRWWEDKKLSEISYKDYEIRLAIQSENYEKAEKLVQSVAKERSPYTPLALSYMLYIERKGQVGGNDIKLLQEILSSLRDKELVSLYKERLAYAYFSVGNYQKALEVLESVKSDDFNYYSAQILKGLVLEKMGRGDQAKAVYSQVEKLARGTYFGNLASAFLMEER